MFNKQVPIEWDWIAYIFYRKPPHILPNFFRTFSIVSTISIENLVLLHFLFYFIGQQAKLFHSLLYFFIQIWVLHLFATCSEKVLWLMEHLVKNWNFISYMPLDDEPEKIILKDFALSSETWFRIVGWLLKILVIFHIIFNLDLNNKNIQFKVKLLLWLPPKLNLFFHCLQGLANLRF